MYRMSELTRNPNAILKYLREQDDESVYVTKEASIILPKAWLNTKLLTIDEKINAVAMFMLRVGKEYTVFNIAGVIELGQGEVSSVLVDGVECVEINYLAGELVINSLNAPVDNTLPYTITDIITKKGSVIPYFTYEDFLHIPETFPKFSNLSIPSYAYTNIYMAYVCRAKEDPRKRVSLGKGGYTNIPLNSVQLAVENTINVFSGGYLDEGIQSKLVRPSDKASMSEVILRS